MSSRLVIACVLVSACSNPPATRAAEAGAAPVARAPIAPVESLSLDDLAAELRALRAVRGHFAGGAWNDDVDAASGRKQRVMAELGRRLGDGHATRARVVALLGEPDVTALRDDARWSFVLGHDASPDATGMLLYFWRGPHDILVFETRDAAVVRSGWWMAGD